MGFFRVILFFLAIYFLLRLIGRLFLQYWVNKKQKEFARQFGQGAPYDGNAANSGSRRKAKQNEGDISVQQTEHINKKVNKNVGDYVEYEEVDIIEENE